MLKTTTLLSLVLLFLCGCGGVHLPEGVTENQVLRPDRETSLEINRPVYYLADPEAKSAAYAEAFTFLEVIEDSRCPLGTNCIRAGEARVRIGLPGGQEATLTLPAGRGGKDLPFFTTPGGRVRVMGLEPYPSAERKRPEGGKYTLIARLLPAE